MNAKYIFTLIGILAIALMLWASPAAADDDWDKSSITLDGKCLADGQVEFKVHEHWAGRRPALPRGGNSRPTC